jgi:Zn finger protein HypA/HybF involved in hydrogenase expression
VKFRRHIFLCEDCGMFIETDQRFLFHCPSCESPHIVSLDECYQNQCRQCRKCYRGGRNE